MTWTLSEAAANAYLTSCKRAAENDNFFNNFKQDAAYRHVLEHVSREEAEIYLKLIKINFDEEFVEVKKNDQFGNPDIYNFEKVGSMSPTTARYLKNTSDIIFKFGKDIKCIVEIGGGYGGLSVVMHPFLNYESYLLIDQYEANLLSKKYLSNFQYPTYCNHTDEIDLDEGYNFDLLISNYAFSECDRDVQEHYIKKFVRNSNKFYMIFNDFGESNIHHKEFCEIISDQFDVEIEPDHADSTPKVLYGVKR
jgi:putative sugar O-methyltransferase